LEDVVAFCDVAMVQLWCGGVTESWARTAPKPIPKPVARAAPVPLEPVVYDEEHHVKSSDLNKEPATENMESGPAGEGVVVHETHASSNTTGGATEETAKEIYALLVQHTEGRGVLSKKRLVEAHGGGVQLFAQLGEDGAGNIPLGSWVNYLMHTKEGHEVWGELSAFIEGNPDVLG